MESLDTLMVVIFDFVKLKLIGLRISDEKIMDRLSSRYIGR